MRISLKWYNISCFQICFPKHRIVFDPYLQKDICGYQEFTDMHPIDAVFLSHSHYDHIHELDQVWKNNQCDVFVSALYAGELVDLFDLSSQLVYPVFPEHVMMTHDLFVLPLLGRHAVPGRMDRRYQSESVIKAQLDPAIKGRFRDIMKYGFMDLYNWLIKDEHGITILFWAGTTSDFDKELLKHYEIDILFLQIPSNTIADNIELINVLKPSYVIPHHHDIYHGNKKITVLMQELRQEIAALSDRCTLLEPELGKWIDIELLER